MDTWNSEVNKVTEINGYPWVYMFHPVGKDRL